MSHTFAAVARESVRNGFELRVRRSATVTNLQQKLESTMTASTLMKEDLAIAKNSLLALQTECCSLRSERDELLEAHRRQLQVSTGRTATGGYR